MAMGVDDIKTAQFIFGECDEDLIDIPSRIDNGCPSCPLTANNITIRLKGPNYQRLENQVSLSHIELNSNSNLITKQSIVKGRIPLLLSFGTSIVLIT
jgi:hypothetical protein